MVALESRDSEREREDKQCVEMARVVVIYIVTKIILLIA